MGKKTKIALTGSLTMLAAGIGSLFYAGNYLYNLALNKQANKDAIFTNPSTNNQIPDKDRTDINKKGDSSNLPVNVIAAIEDCGFTSTWEMFSYQLKEMYNLPSRPFLDIANIVTQIRAGYSFGKAEAIEQVKKSTTPTLFIHGDKDRFVPFKMLNQLYQSANCPKEKLVIKGAGHAQCEKIGGQVYWSKIDSFIRKYQD